MVLSAPSERCGVGNRCDGSERSVSPAQTERICDFDEEAEIVGRLEGYGSEEEEDELTEMSSLCPLYDELLPVEASQLKTKQARLSLLYSLCIACACRRKFVLLQSNCSLLFGGFVWGIRCVMSCVLCMLDVRETYRARCDTRYSLQVEMALLELQQDNPEFVMAALEAIARLAWSDDDVRAAVAVLGGVKTIVDLMTRWREEVGVQCNSCLALMSLLRGEGTICRVRLSQGFHTSCLTPLTVVHL